MFKGITTASCIHRTSLTIKSGISPQWQKKSCTFHLFKPDEV